MSYILRTEKLSKSFGKVETLHDIDISIKQGEVYGLIGQNGAGKTTLLRLVSGLMKPSKGTVILQTEKPFIGYMPQSCRFDDNATAADTIRFFAAIRKANTKDSIQLGKKLELDMEKKVRHLSPGQQKKLQMIIAMAGDPDLYILDEPTAGLDPNATFEMKSIISSIHSVGKSIIISSHILQDMDEICTNIAIMDKGRLTYNNSIESYYVIKTSPIPENVLKKISGKFDFSIDSGATTITARISKENVPQLISVLTLHEISIFEVIASNIKGIVQEQLHIEKRCENDK